MHVFDVMCDLYVMSIKLFDYLTMSTHTYKANNDMRFEHITHIMYLIWILTSKVYFKTIFYWTRCFQCRSKEKQFHIFWNKWRCLYFEKWQWENSFSFNFCYGVFVQT